MGLTPDSNGSKRTFINIIGGRWARKVDSTTEGAATRTYTPQKGKNKGVEQTVHELYYKDLSGMIDSIVIKDGDFGCHIEISMSDTGELFTATLPLESREGKSFLLRLPNLDLKAEVKLAPYNFEGKDEKGAPKQVIGMNVLQNGEKVDWYFTKENPNGIPLGTEGMDKDDFKLLMKSQDIFLKKYANKFIAENFASPATNGKITPNEKAKEPAPSNAPTDDLPF